MQASTLQSVGDLVLRLSSQVTRSYVKFTTVTKLPGVIFDAIFVSQQQQQQHTDLTMSDRESSEDDVCFTVLLWENMQVEYNSAA